MECHRIPELNYQEFSRQFQDKLANRRIPLGGSIELTHRCNLRCAHCYLNVPEGNVAAKAQELGAAEWRRIITEITEQGCLWLLITGGEPLLYPDFWDIYTYAKQQGTFITLFTNATLITPAFADLLARWRPFQVEVSIYGSTPATYEAVTGIPGSYEKSRRGIQLLLERNIPVALKTAVMTLNRHEIRGMRDWAQELGINFRFDPVLNPRLDGSRSPCALRLSPEQVVALDQSDEKRSQGWREAFETSIDYASDPNQIFSCGAGIHSCHIDPYGRLCICLMLRQPSFDLTRGRFVDGWHKFLPQIRDHRRQVQTACADCKLTPLCAQCPGWGQVENGDQESIVEYLCQITRLRARAFEGHNRPKGPD